MFNTTVKRIAPAFFYRERQDVGDDGFFGPALPPGFKKQQSSPERLANKVYCSELIIRLCDYLRL